MLRFGTLLVSVVLGLAAGPVAAQDAPSVHVPEGTAADAVLPVVVVEGGVVERSALPGSIWAHAPAIVVETASVRARLQDPDAGIIVEDAIEAALAAAQARHDIARSPWVLVGFSAAAHHFAHLAWRAPGRFQGLILANAPMGEAHLVHAVLAARGLPTLVINGNRDPVAPEAMGAALAALCERAGLAVTRESLDTADHFAPFQALGAPRVAAWLQRIAASPVERRPAPPQRVTAQAADGVTITGDWYAGAAADAPVVVCFHQARGSRGEYRPIATRLVAEGFQVLAIDQRSGDTFNGVRNRTAAAVPAPAEQLAGFVAARQDCERAVAWAREFGATGPLAILGSSYASSLAIFVGADVEGVTAVISCSPGNYLPPANSILEAGARLTVPTLVICPPNEERQATPVFAAVAATTKELYVQPQGRHGASTLYMSPTADAAWTKVLTFLRAACAG